MKFIQKRDKVRIIRREAGDILDTVICRRALLLGVGTSEEVAAKVIEDVFDVVEGYCHSKGLLKGCGMQVIDTHSGDRVIVFKGRKQLDTETLFLILKTQKLNKRHRDTRELISILFNGFENLIAEQQSENATPKPA